MNQKHNEPNDAKEDKTQKKDFIEKTHQLSNIKKVIGIISGKGGVGKTVVTSLMAVLMNRAGKKIGILDSDITGPSIPKTFGIKTKAQASDIGLYPVISSTGIEIMSINLLLEKTTDPVIWRGPLIANIVKQFWTDVIWNDIDYLFIDMPPGTGDVPLTIFQTIPVDGIVVVTSPQELVAMIVSKAVKMAKMMNIPILGVVENMSYFKCPTCEKEYNIFGESHLGDILKEYDIDLLGRIPIDSNIAKSCDEGTIEYLEFEFLNDLEGKLKNLEGEK